MTSSPFPLGAYVGNPDDGSSTDQASFNAAFAGFTSLLGEAPTYMDTYLDVSDPISSWASSTAFAAASFAQSPDAAATIPVIGLPLSSVAAGSPSADAQFQAFAAGTYDSMLIGVVNTWVKEGFTNLVFRPGWEMNLQDNNSAGNTAQSQADWVSAFQHVYTVLHQAAAADGATIQVVWNPGVTSYSPAEATTNLYPGDSYVDAIGADVYGDAYPFSDSTTQTEYHDWATGGEDTSLAQFIANPINREHYWSEPAATEWSSDSSGGHSQSLTSLISFAEQHDKPFAVPETGAGNTTGGHDVSDDAAFPAWLATQLTAAQQAGETVDFVNLWDSNSGGTYAFSDASDDKPNEAAAWAASFGAKAAAVIGSGPDTLSLSLSEDAWQGDAQFTVSIDGTQVGGVQTATAISSNDQTQSIEVLGSFAGGTHTARIAFLNDAYDGTPTTDRNLYVDGATVDGDAVPGSGLTLYSQGAQSFSFQAPAASLSTVTVDVAEDAWMGDAQFVLTLDGQQLGGIGTATALQSAGQSCALSFSGAWGSGSHTLGISFINDAYGGTSATDRNLYVTGASYNGTSVLAAPVTMYSNGTTTLAIPAADATSAPAAAAASVAGTLTLALSEDAFLGDANVTVAIDGKQVLGPQSVTALHATGATQAVSIAGQLGVGAHDVAISFVNDLYAGSAATDRNLYLDGASWNGGTLAGWTATMLSSGTSHFTLTVPAPTQS